MEQNPRFPFETGGEDNTSSSTRGRKRRAYQPLARVATGNSSEKSGDRNNQQASAERRQDLLERLGVKQSAEQHHEQAKLASSKEARGVNGRQPTSEHPVAVSAEEAAQHTARFHEDELRDESQNTRERAREYSEWASHDELASDELSVGEGVIELNGDLPREGREQEIPLRGTAQEHKKTAQAEGTTETEITSRLRARTVPLAEEAPQAEASRNASAQRADTVTRQTPEAIHEVTATAFGAEGLTQSAEPAATSQERTTEVQERLERPWTSQLPPELVPPRGGRTTAASAAEVPAAPQFGGRRGDQLVTRRELDNEVWEAQRRGMSGGLLLGGLFAFYEHRKHRRREKRQEKRLTQRTKQLEQARSEYQFAAAEQASRQDEVERQLRSTKTQLENSRQATMSANRARPQPEAMNYPSQRPELSPEQQMAAAERSRTGKDIQPASEGPLKVPAEHRLATDGAFIAEVDRATGKVVEKPSSFEYGHEYYQEKAQEGVPAAQRAAATGEVAIAAALGRVAKAHSKSNGGGATAGGGAASSDSGNTVATRAASIPSASTHGTPAGRASDAVTPKAAKTEQRPLWPLLVGLAIVAICLFFVL